MANEDRRRFITLSETAEMISLSVSGCRKLAARGALPIVRIGRTVCVDRRRLIEELEEQILRAEDCETHAGRGR
jgi:excisionase family DNA binding protein